MAGWMVVKKGETLVDMMVSLLAVLMVEMTVE